MIHVTGLRKSFGETHAVAGVDLDVEEREIFGLVGPDGAGKSTTFRLLLRLLAPDAGEVSISGIDVLRRPREARAIVGYMAQQFALYEELSVAENMRFVAEVRNLNRAVYEQRMRELLVLADLEQFTSRLARDLSGGMRRKLALVCALLPNPKILLLDEPTTGIDPVSRREFWRMLYGLPAEGVTLLVSTPYLDEAERCHRLGFMAGGHILAVDTPTGLRKQMPDALVDIRTDARIEARRLLREWPEVRRVETVGDVLRVAFDPAAPGLDEGRALGARLAERGVPVTRCEPAVPTLGDVFGALSDVGSTP